MKSISEDQLDAVTGGVCEGMGLAQCIEGVSEQIGEELSVIGGYISDAWDAWRDYNRLGIWLYETFNC